nr:[FeFe] hydrogenase H-cluster radical SAM maturase HydE [Maliibacterium massiliense]
MRREAFARIDALAAGYTLPEEGYLALLRAQDAETDAYLFEKAVAARRRVYGDAVYVRGLIEVSNYCKNDCLYCGIRRSNRAASRYRLGKAEILACCEAGYALGFRTFVLQGGEDPTLDDAQVVDIVSSIKDSHPDCAVTLSLGEKPRASYQAYFDAGADRYLLRHETASEVHYARLHPAGMSLANRKRCLYDLQEIGYQVGCGMMVGAPYQTDAHLAQDLCFIQQLQPHMVGIGPFIPHKDTPFAMERAGSMARTLQLLGIIRLMLPHVLLPATTALGTIHPQGREKGILAGANVVMPNLSPEHVRGKYMLYDGKINTGAESAQHLADLAARMARIGYRVVVDRGDWKK